MHSVKSYNVLGTFLRNEFTNMHGKPRLAVTPLMLAMYDTRAKLRHEAYAKEWIGNSATPQAIIASSKLKLDKAILIIYLPLIHMSMIFIETGDKIDVIPCSQQFITSENDYDPASIYFYRIMKNPEGIPMVTSQCRCAFDIDDIVGPAGHSITYGYLVAAYVDMFENILSDIDQEYSISYMIPLKENPNYNE